MGIFSLKNVPSLYLRALRSIGVSSMQQLNISDTVQPVKIIDELWDQRVVSQTHTIAAGGNAELSTPNSREIKVPIAMNLYADQACHTEIVLLQGQSSYVPYYELDTPAGWANSQVDLQNGFPAMIMPGWSVILVNLDAGQRTFYVRYWEWFKPIV